MWWHFVVHFNHSSSLERRHYLTTNSDFYDYATLSCAVACKDWLTESHEFATNIDNFNDNNIQARKTNIKKSIPMFCWCICLFCFRKITLNAFMLELHLVMELNYHTEFRILVWTEYKTEFMNYNLRELRSSWQFHVCSIKYYSFGQISYFAYKY